MEAIAVESGVTARPSVKIGYATALTATVLWGGSSILMSYIMAQFNIAPLTMAFWRDFIAGVSLLLILLVVRPGWLRVGWRNVPFLLAFGVFGLAWVEVAWTYSVLLNGAAVATVLASTAPAFVAVVSSRLFGEPLYKGKIAAIVLALIGCALVARVHEAALVRSPLEVGLGMAVGFGFALFSLFGKEASGRMNPWAVTAYAFTFASLALLLTQSIGALGSMGPRPQGWALLVALAILPTLGGDGLYLMSLGHLQASVASVIISLEPGVTASLAFILLGDRLSAVQILGAVLLFVAIAVLQAGGE